MANTRVYVNRTLNLKRIRYIGLDMDHTLIRYNVEEFEKLSHTIIKEKLVKNKIAVMGHVGLTPQTADQLGGFKVQGKDAASAKKIIEQAKSLERAGCFSIVLECVPDQLAAEITRVLEIPTIGIGAGVDCDGQVLVTHDLLGMFSQFHPKFAKQYVDVNAVIKKGVAAFKREVDSGKFPNKDYSFTMSQQEWRKVK